MSRIALPVNASTLTSSHLYPCTDLLGGISFYPMINRTHLARQFNNRGKSLCPSGTMQKQQEWDNQALYLKKNVFYI